MVMPEIAISASLTSSISSGAKRPFGLGQRRFIFTQNHNNELWEAQIHNILSGPYVKAIYRTNVLPIRYP
jgi:hypothetical protein